MRPYILAETNWKALQEHRFDVAVLPWGATEAHNYHLPYGTDNYEADALAAAAAEYAWNKGGKVVVLPTIPFGVNTGQADIYLDMNLNPTTQLAILDDVAATLCRHQVRKLVVFNSHGGNNFKALLRELGLRYPQLFVCMTNWFQAMDREAYFEAAGDHADEAETSLMLHLRPDLVLPADAWGSGASRRFRIGGLNQGWAWAERKWSQVSEDTGVGDPAAATAEKGARFFRDVSEKIGEFLLELSMADPADLYE
ncbi:creatininase family protein [Robiginitalea sp. SC105]|uniref:creatininase family protein n=1 Tax=Robiginitalea sp. SC105 TaxID=2762332 RepID=UPI00163AA8DE|nr:creatininase family protein [Robiginitalea sp. SC105]MBC2839090.1 creatininase family protein [Robiginitalea sp. SC105]